MSWIAGQPRLPIIPRSFSRTPELNRWAADLHRAISQLYTDLAAAAGGIHTQHYEARCSADTSVNSTARVNIAGCLQSVTPRRQADALVFGVYRVHQSAGVALRGFRGELLVDGAAKVPQLVVAFAALAEVLTETQIWRVPNLRASVSYSFQLTGKCDNAADTFIVGQDHSALLILTAGQLD